MLVLKLHQFIGYYILCIVPLYWTFSYIELDTATYNINDTSNLKIRLDFLSLHLDIVSKKDLFLDEKSAALLIYIARFC